MDSLLKFGKTVWDLMSSLAVETPFTLVAIIVVMILYYYLKGRLVPFLKSPNVPQKLATFVQRRFSQLKNGYGDHITSSLLRFIEFGLLLVGATYLCGFLGLALPSTLDDSESNLFKWVNFNSPNGGFSVDFPDNPKLFDQSFTGFDGNRVIMHHLTATRGQYQFDVAYMDFPTYGLGIDADSNMLGEAKDGSLQQIRATVIKESRIRNGSIEGTEVLANVPTGDFVRAQYYLVKNRFYFVLAIQPHSRVGNVAHYRFFDSLKFY